MKKANKLIQTEEVKGIESDLILQRLGNTNDSLEKILERLQIFSKRVIDPRIAEKGEDAPKNAIMPTFVNRCAELQNISGMFIQNIFNELDTLEKF